MLVSGTTTARKPIANATLRAVSCEAGIGGACSRSNIGVEDMEGAGIAKFDSANSSNYRLPAAASARCRCRPVAHCRVLRRLRHELRVETRIRRIEGVHRPIDCPPQVVRLAMDETLPYAAAAGDVDLVARPGRDPALQ